MTWLFRLAKIVCVAAFAITMIWPMESLRFILGDEPLDGWLGSAFGALAVLGVMVVVGTVTEGVNKILSRHDTKGE